MDRTVSIKALTRPHSVLVRKEDSASKEVHVNKIRPYIARVQQVELVFEQAEDFGVLHYAPADTIRKSKIYIWEHIRKIEGVLRFQQRAELSDVLGKYSDVFSSIACPAKGRGSFCTRDS
ncbi:hypothetical protein AVEN_255157-1 [Araneus ventricosus]|uniref:Uncharacterized protein n=1 Tax=Araneus ventricosus TaxID=182803 RepID=A0A4Y2BCI7_ARAVE|nr:hypothetical protein AVEN_255157-1 [Araneus ventricosus]